MERIASDADGSESARLHEALQETLRRPDSFAAGRRDAACGGALKRIVAAFSARAIHFFAHRQVEHNVAVVRTLEAAVRALDALDRRLERTGARLAAVEERVVRLETDVRALRAAEEDARRKLALLGLRLRDLAPPFGGPAPGRESEPR